MPPRTSSKSGPQASQQSASQRGKKGATASQRPNDGSSDEQEYDNNEDDQTMPASTQGKKSSKSASKGATPATTNPQDLQKRANDLVRLALFVEPKRGVLKREVINEKVLGGANARTFGLVFELAQKTLRSVFGMELVELMSRTERDAVVDGAGESSVPGKKKAGTKTYILRSILDASLIKAASVQDRELSRAEAEGVDEDDVAAQSRIQGRILAWQTAEDVNLFGILQVVLCLILVAGRSVSDVILRRQLKSLNLVGTTHLEVGPVNTNKHMSLEDHLQVLMKQNYLDRVRMTVGVGVSATQGPAPSQASRRKSRADDDDAQLTYEWKWGTRAHAEISEQSVAEFLVDFMRERFIQEQLQADDDQAERDRAVVSPELKKKANKYSESVMKDIVRAAGGSLTGANAHL